MICLGDLADDTAGSQLYRLAVQEVQVAQQVSGSSDEQGWAADVRLVLGAQSLRPAGRSG
jgi:hypothetical protein